MRTLSVTASFTLISLLFGVATAAEPDMSRVNPEGQLPDDARLGELRNLRDEYHPWTPPTELTAWQTLSKQIREQILVSNGLWPLPPRGELDPTVHGVIERGDYTIAKVFFASYPGHYVTGNLYRPKNIDGPIPGVLCPHGHWSDARFYDAGDEAAADILAQGGEKYLSGARHHIQARMVQLARMGCVVFHYDMVGYSDSDQIAHREGFTDAEAALRLQNFMGLQTWNSLRALDFLASLPEVDSNRIGVTGASGGGTQTFLLCAIDPRPTVAFPAVMVSTGMQGGCICENASYLRIGLNNIALAAAFAPRPMAMSGADDWTIEIETKGLPELKQVYSLFGKADLVDAQCFPQFKHNYNQVSREYMYQWFNQHLDLGLDSPVAHQDFWPATTEELSVFNEEYPRPEDATDAVGLRRYLTALSNDQFEELIPESGDDVDEYRRVVGTAARVMFDSDVPSRDEIDSEITNTDKRDSYTALNGTVGRVDGGEAIPWLLFVPRNFQGRFVFWVDGEGKTVLLNENGEPSATVRRLLEAGIAVASADLFLTGEYLNSADDEATFEVDENYVGYTFGYNRPLLANRIRDILTIVGGIQRSQNVSRVDLVGTGAAGVWALLARGLLGERIEQTIVDLQGFAFEKVRETSDPMMVPGALKYGDVGGLAALAAPSRLHVSGIADVPKRSLAPLQEVYKASGADGQLRLSAEGLTASDVAELLLQ